MDFNNNNIALLLIIIGTVVFFLFIMPMVDKNYCNEQQKIKENFFANYNSSTNDNDLVKIDTNKCSRSCCGLAQWPVPADMLDKSVPQTELTNYIPSNFSCSQGNNIGGGCVCLTQKDSDYLNNHGSNK